MTYEDLMTHEEAAILAAVLIDGCQNERLMRVLHCDLLPSKAAKCVTHAIRVLDSKDLDVDVITVFEYIRDSGLLKKEYPSVQPLLSIKVLNSIVLTILSASETKALVDGFLGCTEEGGDE